MTAQRDAELNSIINLRQTPNKTIGICVSNVHQEMLVGLLLTSEARRFVSPAARTFEK